MTPFMNTAIDFYKATLCIYYLKGQLYCPLFQLTSRNNEPDFKGAEEDLPRSKEQKKIQIEIRRSIPSNRASNSPVRRSIRNPSTVYISRSHHEGKNPIFDRDDIKRFVPKVPEQRVIAIIPGKDVQFLFYKQPCKLQTSLLFLIPQIYFYGIFKEG